MTEAFAITPPISLDEHRRLVALEAAFDLSVERARTALRAADIEKAGFHVGEAHEALRRESAEKLDCAPAPTIRFVWLATRTSRMHCFQRDGVEVSGIARCGSMKRHVSAMWKPRANRRRCQRCETAMGYR